MADSPKTYVVKLKCYCIGCLNKVKAVFHKLHGMNSVNIDGENRKVTFTGTTELNFVIHKLEKKGLQVQIMDEPAPAPPPPPPPSRPLNIHVTHFMGHCPAPARKPPGHTVHCQSVTYEMCSANNRYPSEWQIDQIRRLAQSQPINSVTFNFGEPDDGGAGSSEDSERPSPPPPQMPLCNYFSDENANGCSIM